MTPSEDPLKEPNLLRCAVKKTLSVIPRHILYASYVIGGLAALGVAYLFITGVVIPLLVPVMLAALGAVASVLALVPWYWYVVLALGLALGLELVPWYWYVVLALGLALVLALALWLVLDDCMPLLFVGAA